MILSRCFPSLSVTAQGAIAAAAVGLLAPAAASASCAGLSSDAIGARFSAARAACGDTGSGVPATRSSKALIDAGELPRSVAISFPGATRREAVRARVAASRLGPNPHHSTVVAVAQRYRIDPMLLHAIVRQESGYKLTARSNKGALGLMQLMPGTARGLGVTDTSRLTRDPLLNLSAGAAYLKQLQSQLGNNLPNVLAAYNAGPGAVRRHRGIPPYRETRNYVGSIMSRYGQMRGQSR